MGDGSCLGCGSSPHTRGAPPGRFDMYVRKRIIPAYAGSTYVEKLERVARKDHPRIRGEHDTETSSPYFLLRIIPAYAGSTPSTSGQIGGDADHPRIRGEHPDRSGSSRPAPGSSPHTRGARVAGVGGCFLTRIIPAYAGSTSPPTDDRNFPKDHPRIRGEHPLINSKENAHDGSSPHTRGAQPAGAVRVAELGIIPAYAGSTSSGGWLPVRTRDHPRIRGEHRSVQPRPGGAAGSSPHTRGAQMLTAQNFQRQRIIPAYAGSTRRGTSWPSLARDHPRIRGEHFRPVERVAPGPGSSPQTRGAQKRPERQREGRRIIPAYAGSTAQYRNIVKWQKDHPRIRGEHL